MRSKKGSEKYYIIISLILGLMILAISLFWIFNEYFTEEDIEWEVCRQSILLRNALPEEELASLKLDVKGAFPLKCKTEVVTIDNVENPEDVYKIISDTVATGWYLFGEGKFDFVHRSFSQHETLCMAFARIHFDERAVSDFYKEDFPAWNDYFGEKYDSRVSLEALDQVKESIGQRNSQKAFIDYYQSAGLPNSEGTYDDYLSLYMEEASQDGNLAVGWEDVHFFPDGDNDYILVYRINKASGASETWFGKSLTSIVYGVGGVLGVGKSVEDKSISWEDYKSIAIATIDNLDILECNKFLTIPA
jgi:hypothetical protein